MQKNILCFGDSNTHGYNSKTGGRFDVNERWTKLLQKNLGDDYYIIEEGLSGRTTSFEDPVFEGLCGLNAVSYTHLDVYKRQDYYRSYRKEH